MGVGKCASAVGAAWVAQHMSGKSDKLNSKTSPEVRNEVIDRLYEVAMDPTRYEEFLDHWENMIRPLRKGANGALVDADLDAEYYSHFMRADKFLERLDDHPTQASHLPNVDKAATFLVGRNFRFVDMNKAAETVLGIHKDNKLSDLPIEASDLQALERLTAKMLMGNSDKSTLFRAHLVDTEQLIIFQLKTLHQDDSPPLVIAITSAVIWPDGFCVWLKSAFELTRAEVDIVKALTECQSLHEIAKARARSVDTVRAQLKSILAKTEARSQTELVRLMLSMMDIASYTNDTVAPISGQSIGTKGLLPRPFHVLTLRDGRKMDYLILGDPAGKPCLFLPLAYGLVRWPASAEAQAAKRGMKIVVPVRAGYGNSSPFPKEQALGPTIADDLAQLMDHLEIETCPFISLGSDVFFSIYFHQAYPTRVNAILACAGTFPLNNATQYERMGKWHRFILASARYTPHLLPFMVKAGFSLARRTSKRAFTHAVFRSSKVDVAAFETPEIYEAVICGSEVSLSDSNSSHKQFALEAIAQETTDWGVALAKLEGKIPVHYLNGLHDPQAPPETLREFEEKHPWINFHKFEDAGQLVFFMKWRTILPMIEKYL